MKMKAHPRFRLRSLILSSTAALLVFGLAACGKDETEPKYAPGPAGTNRIIPSLTAEQRAQYCMVYTEAENDPMTLNVFLGQLDGKWKYLPTVPRENGVIFRFDLAKHYASLTQQDIFHSREDITYRKICVSRPLSAELGGLAGYRLVEMMAANNEGGIAFAVKFDAPAAHHDYPVLLMTERVYERWASRNALEKEGDVLTGKVIRTFPNRL
ncbi:MAG: hypothetical protein H7222_17165 [Methylotenera sp.]|nr:hypothetical protein [Oligoflexia bacterium]